MKSKPFNIDFALCHILREIGFHKESDVYFVKTKSRNPKIFSIQKGNFWSLSHYDWNRYNGYKVSFSKRWKTPWNSDGIPIFSYYDYDGYLCTVPSLEQIIDFCKLNNIHVNYNNKGTLILSLIEFYRSKSKHHRKAFEKYVYAIKNYSDILL